MAAIRVLAFCWMPSRTRARLAPLAAVLLISLPGLTGAAVTELSAEAVVRSGGPRLQVPLLLVAKTYGVSLRGADEPQTVVKGSTAKVSEPRAKGASENSIRASAQALASGEAMARMKEAATGLTADGMRGVRPVQSGGVRFYGSPAGSIETNGPLAADFPEMAGDAMAWLGGLGALLVLLVAGASAIRSPST